MTDDFKRHVGLFRNVFLHYSETFIHDELRHHQKYKTTVFTRQWKNANRFPGHDVRYVEKLPSERHPLASMWYGLTGRNRGFMETIKESGIDILHAHFGHNGLYALPYAKALNLPLVVSLHGRDVTILLGNDRFHPGYWKYLVGYRRLIREADLFLAASSELKSLMEQIGCPKDKVVVNTLGIDLKMFQPSEAQPNSDRPLILMVGRFVEKKGHEYGIRAAAMARDAGCNFELVLVGDGPLKVHCEQLIEELHLGDRVRMPGEQPHSEIQKLMSQAFVVMAPSVIAKNLDRESGIIVLKEAAASGVPAIGTLHGGIPDIIDHGETGYLVPERDAASIGKHLIALLNNTALRQKMGAAARQKMEQEYNIITRVQHLESIYDEVIDRHKQNR
ncbi:MAG: glycosyltransferase [Deltaproteobacteria bacterium]|nr:glycosyltransferase [Deltaproteobacteria bacterium]